jgi:CheY-like chemotaxis protein
MDEDTRKRIFEPFFTTKEVGKGTGLGLAMAYGIITQHKGAIEVLSESGRGTTFHIFLPISMRKSDVQWEKYTPRSPASGAETILVAEDDASLRLLSKTVLQESGYRVIEAVDGEDAVAKFVLNRDSINLLLFDVIMPKKNGREAYDEIKKIQPSIKALFLSGYTADIVLDRGIEQEGMNFIKKPLAPWELLEKIRTVLDRKAT